MSARDSSGRDSDVSVVSQILFRVDTPLFTPLSGRSEQVRSPLQPVPGGTSTVGEGWRSPDPSRVPEDVGDDLGPTTRVLTCHSQADEGGLSHTEPVRYGSRETGGVRPVTHSRVIPLRGRPRHGPYGEYVPTPISWSVRPV